jgi:hypothetical protein
MPTTKINTGGPAFPRPLGNNGRPHFEDSEVSPDQEGMSTRDWFAGQALIGVMVVRTMLIERGLAHDVIQESLAEEAYELADAMIAEREKTHDED